MLGHRGLWRLRLATRHALIFGSTRAEPELAAGLAPSSYLLWMHEAQAFMRAFHGPGAARLFPVGTSDLLGSPSRCLSTKSGRVVSFPLPQTGEGIKECELIQWFVKEGQTMVEFDKMCEVQSDKASVEITSRYSGTVLRLHAAEGDIVQVGAPLLDIQVDGTGDEEAVAEAAPLPPPAAPAGTPADARAGAGGDGAVRASPAVRRIAREHHLDLAGVTGTGPGGRVTKEDLEAHLAREKGGQVGTDDGPSPMASVQAPGDVMGAGGVLDDVAGAGTGTGAGTAAGGLPTQELRAAGEREKPEAPPRAAPRDRAGPSYDVPLRGFQRAMVKSMTAAGAVPHFHFCDEVRMDELLRVRNLLRPHSPAKLTFLPFVIKAISIALREFPEVNSSMQEDGASLRVHGPHNLGVAMATPFGLVVPNIKGVEGMSLTEIAGEVTRLQEAAAANRLQPADLADGTITVSNIGAIGGTYAAPLVNGREVAIVALGRLQETVRFVESEGMRVPAPASVVAVSWGADHRVLDGATLAKFSNVVKALLEQPERLLLHMS